MAMKNRGPDDYGFASWGAGISRLVFGKDAPTAEVRIALAHRRLSILDLSERGCQPMMTNDGLHGITYNGEVYNYLELRNELEGFGETFVSGSDTEVILSALRRWGISAVKRFRGMFAFCWINLEKGEFHLVRDCFGIKPFYIAQYEGGWAFASEQRALLLLPGISRRISRQQVYDFLRFGVNDDGRSTLFSSIQQVPPGHYLVGSIHTPGDTRSVKYWEPDFNVKSTLSFKDAAAQMRELFIDNVRLHLRSDVPIGAALSGGIDSSAIVGCMRMLEPDLEINTFSYTPQGHEYNEAAWANMMADRIQAKRHFVDLLASDVASELDYMLDVQEDPFSAFSHHAQNKVFRKAREEGVVVMLNGQGGDEILAGYPMYFAVRVAGALQRKDYALLWKWWRDRKDVGGGHSAGWLMAGDHVLPDWLKSLARRAIGKKLFPAYLNAEWFRGHDLRLSRLEAPLGRHGLSGYLWDTLNRTNLPNLLHYDDRNSMAYSQESRVPFLTTEFVEFALSLPEEYLIDENGVTKKVFREAMRGIVPAPILERKDKIGFHTPRAEFLRKAPEWVEGILATTSAELKVIINLPRVAEEWRQIKRGKVMKGLDFWRVLCFLRWAQLRKVKI